MRSRITYRIDCTSSGRHPFAALCALAVAGRRSERRRGRRRRSRRPSFWRRVHLFSFRSSPLPDSGPTPTNRVRHENAGRVAFGDRPASSLRRPWCPASAFQRPGFGGRALTPLVVTPSPVAVAPGSAFLRWRTVDDCRTFAETVRAAARRLGCAVSGRASTTRFRFTAAARSSAWCARAGGPGDPRHRRARSRHTDPGKRSRPSRRTIGSEAVRRAGRIPGRVMGLVTALPCSRAGRVEVADPRAEPRATSGVVCPRRRRGDQKNHQQLRKANRSHASPRCPRRHGRGNGCRIRTDAFIERRRSQAAFRREMPEVMDDRPDLLVVQDPRPRRHARSEMPFSMIHLSWPSAYIWILVGCQQRIVGRHRLRRTGPRFCPSRP